MKFSTLTPVAFSQITRVMFQENPLGTLEIEY